MSFAESAAKIQATIRGHKGRALVTEKRENYLMIKNVTLVAALWKGHVARRLVKERKYNNWVRRVATIKLQCFFRYFLAKNHIQRMRDKRWMTVAPYAATKIQQLYRGMKGRERAENHKRVYMELQKKKLRSCIKLQAIFRQILANNLMGQLKIKKMSFQHEQHLACVIIQSIWRMKVALMTLNRLKLSFQNKKKRDFNAATCLIRSVRTMQFRFKIEERVKHTTMIYTKAAKIQFWYRKKVLYQKKKIEKKVELEVLRQESVIIIQKNWRRKQAFITMLALRKDYENEEKLKYDRAFILTTWFRICLAKGRLHMLKAKHIQDLELCFKVETKAAIQIESCWRGYQGRLKSHAAIKAKKSRWKQMWSENDKRYYYYNQVCLYDESINLFLKYIYSDIV